MKNKLKYLITVILVVVLSSALVVSASAEGEADIQTEEAVEENFFTAAYEEISSYASEILCGLTLAASLILAFAYKKGLIPLIRGALVSISNAVTTIGESAKASEEQTARLGENLDGDIESIKSVLDSVGERVASLGDAVNERVRTDEKAQKEYERLSLIVEAQIDMLYDIFMSSALPQYQKDAVGERIAKMKEATTRNEGAV